MSLTIDLGNIATQENLMATAPICALEEAPRVYSYTRFSTPEQAEGDSQRRQADGARRWMERKNAERAAQGLSLLALDERLSLSDLGVSAYRGTNIGEDKGLGGFLRACRDGLIAPGSYLLVESLDRISRMTPRRVSRLLDDIVDAGVVIATLSDGQEYDADRLDGDPTALLIALMVSWRAHEESKMKGQRIGEVWKEKRRRVRAGLDAKLTGRCPGWLHWTTEGWQERLSHGEAVRRIYRMTIDGMGEHKIARCFNAEGVPVMGRGKMWHRSTVSKILRNPAVIGTLVPGQMHHTDGKAERVLEPPIPNVFPAVISQADWTTVRALKDGIARAVRGRGANAPLSNIFAGLARCPECGAAMTRVYKGSGPKCGKPKLVCTKAKAGAASHSYRSITLPDLHDAFERGWQRLVAEVPAGNAGTELDRDHADLCGTIDAAERELADLTARFERSPSSALSVRLRALNATLASYRADMDALEHRQALADHGLVASRVGALADLLEPEEGEPGNVAKVNACLRTLFSGVTIDYLTGQLRFQWRQGGETPITYAWVE
ncbi:recombinase family protein [Caenibius tardaugens]|nr:recombinase family protein [Caenibius tardaugens]